MKKVCYQLILPTLLVLLISGGAFAADNEILRELQALKQRMVVLEQKLIDQDAMQQPAADVAIAEQETASVRQIVEEVVAASKPAITVGGAVRAQYSVKDWSDASQDKGGDFSFDTFRFDLNGSIGDMILSAQYRFYPEYDFNTIHHGYIGYNFTDDLQGQIGVQQVPFGLQPYASHNFWFSGAYYVGLEDDYDMGIKLLYTPGPLSITAAFYKNGELGDASNSERYSVDVISSNKDGYAGSQGAGNGESNQGNLRVAYLFEHGENASSEIGVSGQYGGIYNDNTGNMGEHWAGAVHLNGNYGPFNLQLEYVSYQYNVDNPAGSDDDIITLGCYGYSWGAPSDADIGIFNLSYSLPVNWGPVSNLTFYSDNTIISPDESRFEDIWQNVVGMMVTSGPVYTYFDIISGENMIFSGGNMVDSAGTSDNYNERTTRFNINIGYYF
ncbi:MAG: hypothetical protein JRG71_02795 [Deltaproteobacteria bacterium]|jgi:hypothetical protein|nr:hypothetical protein [Deltaproteobacteria bacterium]